MAESVVSFAVQTIGNLFAEEARFLHGVKDQVEELQSKLKWMQWFLKDDRIHEWILEVIDIAYDAEDLVEKYAFRVGSHRDGGLVHASFVDEGDFVGLESDVDLLVKHLVGDCRGVVSISGLGGSGKTTVAKKVYNHPSVKRHFDGLAWICVSQQWQAKEMLRQILIKLVHQSCILTERRQNFADNSQQRCGEVRWSERLPPSTSTSN